jgi:hypothetical protein
MLASMTGRSPEVLMVRARADFRVYWPFTEATGLFRTFADLDATPKAILTFANKYGWLSKPAVISKFRKKPPAGADATGRGELLSDWRVNIGRLKELVSLWDMIRERDSQTLERRIRVKLVSGQRIAFYSPEHVPESDLPVAGFVPGISTFGLDPPDLTRPAKVVLMVNVNALMEGEIGVELRADEQLQRFSLAYEPHGLFGVILLQFARAIAGNKDYRRCAVCTTWFELIPPETRITRQTCSDACRQRQYRQRQKQARGLRAAGKTVREIAKELGAETHIIKNWLTTRRRRRKE